MKNVLTALLALALLLVGARAQAQINTDFPTNRGSMYGNSYASPLGGRLVLNGNDVYMNGRMLQDYELQQIMGPEIWNNTFLGARSQYSAGKVLVNIGVPLMSAGAGFCIYAYIAAANGYTTSALSYLVAGYTLFGSGFTVFSIGIPLQCVGSGRMRWAVGMAGRGYSFDPQLNVGLTPGGVGLCMKF